MISRKSLFVFLALFQTIFFIECTSVFGQYRFETWTTDDGLPQNGVRAITQTPEGYLWFTTFDGLVRFDGLRFTTFNKNNTKGIINNRFTALYGDKDGTLYATTMEDGILTIYRNGVFSSLNSDEVPGHYIQSIEPDGTGELRFLTEDESRTSKSWYYLRDGKFIFSEKGATFLDPRYIDGRDGAKWIVTPTETREIRDGKTTVYALDFSYITFRVNTFVDSDGALWIGENRVHRLHHGQIETFDESKGFLKNSIYHSFWEDEEKHVWFASGGGSSTGIGIIQYKDGKYQIWGSNAGLTQTSIISLFRDRENSLWLATDKGLSRMRRKVLSAFSRSDGIKHPETYPLFRDRQGVIWIGTNRGLSTFRDGKFETVELKPQRPDAPEKEIWKADRMSVQSLWEDAQGKLWVGLNGGLYIVENGRAEMVEGTYGTHFFDIHGDRNGNVWTATNKGLWQFRDYRRTVSFTVKEGLPNEFMTFIFEDSKGELWFGGLGGLSHYKDGRFINYTTREGLTGNYVRTIYEDREGTFWIGTYDEGLSRFKDGRFVNFKEENGLYNSGVFAIEEDSRGNFWISSNRGIYRVRRQELNDFADGKTKKINSVGYGKEDGMLSTECNGGRQPASLRDDQGRFWFPTQDGVVIVDAEQEMISPLPPRVVIENVTVEREPTAFAERLTVEPWQRNVEINFTGISLIKSEQVKFKYKLEGHDEDWVDAGTRRTAFYSYLPPGNYKFRVIAANSEGFWNEQGASLEVRMLPFFYQTKLFIALSVITALVVLLIVWKISVYQLEARERKLTKLVSERTEELHRVNAELENLANSDGLTKIGNRRRFEKFLTDEWHRAVRFKTEISLVLLDIDHFKLYNDRYGHQVGDECLQKVAEALADAIHRPTDLVARFGGEEFAIVLGGTSADGAMTIARQAVENIRSLKILHESSKTHRFVTVSVGIATIFPKFETAEAELVKMADQALYRAKADGRNRIILNDQTNILQTAMILDEEFINAG